MHVLVPCGWLLYAPVHKWHRQGSSWLTERASCCQRTCTGSQQSSLGVNNTLRGLTFLNCDTLWLLVTGLFRDQISFDLNFYASVSRKRDIWNLTHSSTLQNTNNFLLWSIDVIFIKKKNKTKEPDNADKEEQLDKVDEQAGEEEGDEKEDVNNL